MTSRKTGQILLLVVLALSVARFSKSVTFTVSNSEREREFGSRHDRFLDWVRSPNDRAALASADDHRPCRRRWNHPAGLCFRTDYRAQRRERGIRGRWADHHSGDLHSHRSRHQPIPGRFPCRRWKRDRPSIRRRKCDLRQLHRDGYHGCSRSGKSGQWDPHLELPRQFNQFCLAKSRRRLWEPDLWQRNRDPNPG